ncbi:MAG: hypothetical protein HDR05_12505 [Lachnospiraceae bacterium]|nr:hypothetical protein [Lachnospiraceae bacterium]
MLICIGKIEKNNGVLEACKIADSISKEVRILSVQKAKEILKAGIPIKGLLLSEKYFGKMQYSVKRENTNTFKFSKVPKINGAGELINTEDEKVLTVYGWSGFAELKQYHFFNYKGETVILSKQEFEDKVHKKEINGAYFNDQTGKIVMVGSLNVEV